MGFDLDLVKSDERHYGPFECLICQGLVDSDAWITVPCSHVFCRSCMQSWLVNRCRRPEVSGPFGLEEASSAATPTCPTCHADLLLSHQQQQHHTTTSSSSSSSSQGASSPSPVSAWPSLWMMVGGQAVTVQPLARAQPLAFRVLQRIQVKCPIKGADCSWTGDYGDLSAHWLSPSAHALQQPLPTATRTPAMTTTTTTTTAAIQEKEEEAASLPATAASATGPLDSPASSSTPRETGGMGAGSTTQAPMQVDPDSDSPPPQPESHSHGASPPPLDLPLSPGPWAQRIMATAQSYKEQGNEQFSTLHYTTARDLYTKGLEILQPLISSSKAADPASSSASATEDQEALLRLPRELLAQLYANRAAANLALQQGEAAVQDASLAIYWLPTYAKAHVRKAKALIGLGRFEAAVQALQQGLDQIMASQVAAGRPFSDSRTLQRELDHATQLLLHYQQALTYLQQGQYAEAKATFGRLLSESTAPNVVLGAAQADLGLGATDSALRLTQQVLRKHAQQAHPAAYRVRGHCFILMGEMDMGLRLLKEALRLDPDDRASMTLLKECRQVQSLMEQAKSQIFHRQFEAAVDSLTEAVKLASLSMLPPRSPLYCSLYTERARAYLRLKKYEAVLKDCALVLYQRDDYVEAWLLRLSALQGLERYQEALDEVSELMNKWGSNDERIRHAHQKAEFELRKQQRPDYYALLGVSELASEREIKKAYRLRALECHPDRFMGEEYTDVQRQEAHKQFQMLQEGLEVLTDDFSRRLYNEGYDLAAIKERIEAAQRAAHSHQQGYPYNHHK